MSPCFAIEIGSKTAKVLRKLTSSTDAVFKDEANDTFMYTRIPRTGCFNIARRGPDHRLYNSAFLWTPTLYWAWPALCGSEELLGGCTPSRASAAVGSAASASSLRPRWLHISPSAFWAFSAGMAARDQEGPTTLPVMLTSMPMLLELRRPRCEAPPGAAHPHAHHVPHVTPLTHMCCLLSSS